MAISEEEAEHYDSTLEPIEKKVSFSSQEEFYIMVFFSWKNSKIGFEIGAVSIMSQHYYSYEL